MAFRESLAIRLRAAYLRLHRSANRHFRSYDATADQYALLTCLAEESGVTQQALVDSLASDKRTINKMVDLLEEKGFIERREHPEDGRAWSLFLTSAGRRHQELLYDSADYLRRRLEESVPPEHLEIVLDSLSRMAERLDPDSVDEKLVPKEQGV